METSKRKTISFVGNIEGFDLFKTNKKKSRKGNKSKERNNEDYAGKKPYNAYAVFCKEIRKEYALRNKEISLIELGRKWERLTMKEIDEYIDKYKQELEAFYRRNYKRSKSATKINVSEYDKNKNSQDKRKSLFCSSEKKVKYHKMLYSYNPELNNLIIKSCQKVKPCTEIKPKPNMTRSQSKRKTIAKSKKKKCFCGKCRSCLND